MLIFVIMRMQWTDGTPLELSVRNKNCQPHSYYKDSIKQVVLFLAQAMDDVKLGRVQDADEVYDDIVAELESLDL